MNEDKYECINLLVYKDKNVYMYKFPEWLYFTDALSKIVGASQQKFWFYNNLGIEFLC